MVANYPVHKIAGKETLKLERINKRDDTRRYQLFADSRVREIETSEDDISVDS